MGGEAVTAPTAGAVTSHGVPAGLVSIGDDQTQDEVPEQTQEDH